MSDAGPSSQTDTVDIEQLRIDRKPRRRQRGLGSRLWPVLGLAALGLLLFLSWPAIQNLVDRFRLPEVRLMVVRESHPAASAAAAGTAANGHIVAARRAALSADAPGRIVELAVREGSKVEKGAIVARLYADELAAALRAAQAREQAARATLLQAQAARKELEAQLERQRSNEQANKAIVDETQANVTLAETQWRRARDLQERGAASTAAVDDADASLAVARARLASARFNVAAAAAAIKETSARVATADAAVAVATAQLPVATAEVELAAATLDKTNVRAPFAGVVVLKDAEIGEVVSPNSQGGSNARGSVCTLVDFASLEVQAEIPETSLAKVQHGGPALVYLDAWPGHEYQATVDRIWPTANRQQATVEVRLRLLQRDERLRPDMGVRVVFTDAASTRAPNDRSTEQSAAILIPESAIVRTGGSTAVFVVERDVARLQSLELGNTHQDKVQVRRGLVAGQRIILEPPSSLQDGGRIRTRQDR